MMRTVWKILFSFVSISILSFGISSHAQSDANYWVYQTIETEDAYEIIRTNALDNTVEIVTSIPKTPTFNLRSIIPDEELAAAERWYTGSISSPIGVGIPDALERPPHSWLRDVIPSPDGTQLALTVGHSLCPGQTNKCFGVSQVVIVDANTGQQSILWTLSHVADSEFFPYCYTGFIYHASSVDTDISQIRWTPDQSSIVAMIYYESYGYPPDYPLIVIPTDAPQNAFAAGNGEGGWTISPDSRKIASISRDCDSPTRENDIVRITTLDLDTKQHSFQDYSVLHLCKTS